MGRSRRRTPPRSPTAPRRWSSRARPRARGSDSGAARASSRRRRRGAPPPRSPSPPSTPSPPGPAPAEFPIAPIDAVRRVLDRAKLTTADIDLYEINEAFAVVALACLGELGLDPARVNVHGGAIALGHPIGASGARVLVTLLHAL